MEKIRKEIINKRPSPYALKNYHSDCFCVEFLDGEADRNTFRKMGDF